MNHNPVRTFLTTALAVWGIGYSLGIPALTLPNTPLLITSGSVSPNVMFQIDTSGSMHNVIWATGFNPAITYPDWSNGNSLWSAASGNILLSAIAQGTCAAGFKRGFRGVTKCLRLPDPVGTINPPGPLVAQANLTRYTGNYLNYLFDTYANGTDLTAGQIPNDYRMNVARNVTSNLVNTTPGMRFGVSSFFGDPANDYGHGATINAECKDPTAPNLTAATNAVQGLDAVANTPLAEALYELTRYFRGLTSFYGSPAPSGGNNPYVSPIQYRCQKNFVIVVTDGLPTRDTNIPTNDSDDVADTTAALPNWDNQAPATSSATFPIFPQYSDGFQPTGNNGQEGFSLYLDDLAKFAFDIDMKKTGNDLAGKSYQDPVFPKQNLNTYTVGFSVANQMLQDAAGYGGGQYFTATDAASLQAALQQALSSIQLLSSSASAVAVTSGSASSSTTIYQGTFNSSDWRGNLTAFGINPLTGAIFTTPLWDAASHTAVDATPIPAARTIFTINPAAAAGSRGVAFATLGSLTTGQQAALNTNALGTPDPVGTPRGQDRLDYLRGAITNEAPSGLGFRARPVTKLGDMVNSAPTYVAQPFFLYADGLESQPYSQFRNNPLSPGATAGTRTPAIYVGANDGMLHAFDAGTGAELFAFVPNAVFPNLSKLTGSGYNSDHRFFVDGSPAVGDAFFGGAWHTVLAGGLNNGGQSIYALEVTDPTAFNASKVLWEYTDADLGFTYSQPSIVRMANGVWAAVFGNGYNNTQADGSASTTGRAYLYIVNIATGALIRKIDTGVGGTIANPNGLATPAPVDVNGDSITDFIYAGDLLGKLWKFDVTATNPNSWGLASNGAPLFAAMSSTNTAQPITSQPSVGVTPTGDQIVLFGTGKLLEPGDIVIPASPPRESFYGIIDDDVNTVGGRGSLLQQTVDFAGSVTFGPNTVGTRVTSNNAYNTISPEKGWYIDLPTDGERQIANSVLRNGRIIFVTVIPKSTAADPCDFGGTGWLMQLNAHNGSRLTVTPFDSNGDGKLDSSDFATVTIGGASVTVPVSGRGLNAPPAGPTVVSAGDKELIYTGGGTAGGGATVGSPGPSITGRQSWRQLQ